VANSSVWNSIHQALCVSFVCDGLILELAKPRVGCTVHFYSRWVDLMAVTGLHEDDRIRRGETTGLRLHDNFGFWNVVTDALVGKNNPTIDVSLILDGHVLPSDTDSLHSAPFPHR